MNQKRGMEAINKILENFGKDLDDKPFWRVVWAPEQLEYRHGTFRDFRELDGFKYFVDVTETRQVKRYNYIGDRWVLERWLPPDLAYNPEVPASQFGDFFPIFVFEDAKGEPLPVTETVVRHLVRIAEKSQSEAHTEKQITDEEKERERKEIFDLALMLGYDGPDDAPIGKELEAVKTGPDTSQFLRS